MRLIHHMVPFAIQEFVICCGQVMILTEQRHGILSHGICTSSPLPGIEVVLGGSNMNAIYNVSRQAGMENHLEERWLRCRAEAIVYTLGFVGERFPLA